MEPKKKSLIAEEIVFLSIRINQLRAEKLYVNNTIFNFKKLTKHNIKQKKILYKNIIKELNESLYYIDIEYKKRRKRISKLVPKLFKDSKLFFEERPSSIIPSTEDIKQGYIPLTEKDTEKEYALLFDTGDILPMSDYETQRLIAEYYVSPNLFEKIKSHLILLNTIKNPSSPNYEHITMSDKIGLAIDILKGTNVKSVPEY